MEYLSLVTEIETLKAALAEAHAEIAALKEKPQAKTKPVKVPCPCLTVKGHPCKKFCPDGEETCKVHARTPAIKKNPPNPRGFSVPA